MGILRAIARIAGPPSVTKTDIQVSVRSERHHPAIMIGIRLLDDHEHSLIPRSRTRRAATPILRHDRGAIRSSRVIHKESPVATIVRMKSQPQEPSLTVVRGHAIAQVQEGCRP
ncbi:MAG: hypothetical protein EWM73_02858 [Nitrospira sp.]|nr:MAG: hypothetical protein EWM73_02858 [Nitrospira sp.]